MTRDIGSRYFPLPTIFPDLLQKHTPEIKSQRQTETSTFRLTLRMMERSCFWARMWDISCRWTKKMREGYRERKMGESEKVMSLHNKPITEFHSFSYDEE